MEHLQSLAETVDQDSSLALFAFLEQLPFSGLVSLIAVAMVVVFFVTSADSGALVVDLLASGGQDRTPVWQRIFWSALMGVVAIALLLADGLKALQTATIASALPFSVILLLSIWGLFRALGADATKRSIRYQAVSLSQPAVHGESWQRRLRGMLLTPRRSQVMRFIEETVAPACESVAEELRKQGLEVEVLREEQQVSLEVHHGEQLDFRYAVLARSFIQPSFVMRDTEDTEERKYFRAEVHLREGGQDYDVMGWRRDRRHPRPVRASPALPAHRPLRRSLPPPGSPARHFPPTLSNRPWAAPCKARRGVLRCLAEPDLAPAAALCWS